MSLREAVTYASKGRGARARPKFGWEALTPAERQVAELVKQGLTNPEIAERLFVAPRTVRWHLSGIFAKLEIDSRKGLREPGQGDLTTRGQSRA